MTCHPIVFNVDDTASPKGMYLSYPTTRTVLMHAARARKKKRQSKPKPAPALRPDVCRRCRRKLKFTVCKHCWPEDEG